MGIFTGKKTQKKFSKKANKDLFVYPKKMFIIIVSPFKQNQATFQNGLNNCLINAHHVDMEKYKIAFYFMHFLKKTNIQKK